LDYKIILTMKINIVRLSLLSLFVLGTTSCTSWLDILPEGEIILDEYWQTESEAEAVLAACYRGMIETDYTRRMLVWGEGRSDNFNSGTTILTDLYKTLNQELEPTNTFTDWSSFYSVINYCNTFLKYAPEAQVRDDNFTLESLHSMEAEVLTIRALSYFYLVRAFGSVPWITTPSIDDAQNYLVGQSSERAILDSIIVDLEYASSYAKTRFSSNVYTKGRITQDAVYALMADIYLWDQKYDECISACNMVLSDPYLELVDAENMFSEVFYSGNSTETIFELQFDDDVQINYTTRNFYGYSGNQTSMYLVFPSVLVESQYSPFEYAVGGGYTESEDDYRAKDFIINNSSTTIYKIFKYAGMSRKEDAAGTNSTYDYRSNTSNWIVYRLSDVILMKAEALIQRDQEGGIEPALSLVNTTYLRSNPTADSLKSSYYNGASDIEKLVLRERQRELMFEGKRYFDLMRVALRDSTTSQVTSYVSKTSSSTEIYGNMSSIQSLYWPINKDELIANPTLTQNSFYESSYSSSKN